MRKKASILGRVALAAFALLITAGLALADTRDPLRKGVIFDDDFSSAAAIFSEAISTAKTTGALRITVALTGTDSVFNLQVILASPAKTYTLALNDGTALVAGRLYTFTVGVDEGYTYNFTCTTGTRVAYLLVEESTSDGL